MGGCLAAWLGTPAELPLVQAAAMGPVTRCVFFVVTDGIAGVVGVVGCPLMAIVTS